MKQKLNLTELKVKSFVTDLTAKENETLKEMKGGTIGTDTTFTRRGICDFTKKMCETLGCSHLGDCPIE